MRNEEKPSGPESARSRVEDGTAGGHEPAPPDSAPEGSGSGPAGPDAPPSHPGIVEVPADEYEALRSRAEERDRLFKEFQRKTADYLNDMNRLREERRLAEDVGLRRFLIDLFPVVDDLYRALASVGQCDTPVSENLLAGLRMVEAELLKILGEYGVAQIEVKPGDEFDPRFHEAVAGEANPSARDGTILEEVRKGYTFRGTVIRATRVKVARNPAPETHGQA